METDQAIIECLKILISWPVAIIVILILLKKELPKMAADLARRLKKVEVGGQTFEFSDDLENQSRMTEVIENIQRENPDLLKKSLESAGVKENEFQEFRSTVRNRVLQVQKFLQELGYDLGDTGVDGITGPKTKSAVQKFQDDHGLVPDGVIGPKTLNMINEIRIKKYTK